jgi:nicotinamide riboside kinase
MRIAFTGAQGTGKSTLAEVVGERHGLPILPTPGRTMKSRGLPINEHATVTSQTLAWLLQLELEASGPAWIAARTLVDVWAYGVLAAQRATPSDVESALLEQLSTTTERLLPTRYDVLFYLPPRIPLKADDARVDVQEFQRKTDLMIRSGLECWSVEYVEIDVTAPDAVELVLAEVAAVAA